MKEEEDEDEDEDEDDIFFFLVFVLGATPPFDERRANRRRHASLSKSPKLLMSCATASKSNKFFLVESWT